MPDLGQLIDLEYLSMGIVTALVFVVVSPGDSMCVCHLYLKKPARIRHHESHGSDEQGNDPADHH